MFTFTHEEAKYPIDILHQANPLHQAKNIVVGGASNINIGSMNIPGSGPQVSLDGANPQHNYPPFQNTNGTSVSLYSRTLCFHIFTSVSNTFIHSIQW